MSGLLAGLGLGVLAPFLLGCVQEGAAGAGTRPQAGTRPAPSTRPAGRSLLDQFLLDGLLVPQEEILAGGPPKDGIPALTHPPTAAVERAGSVRVVEMPEGASFVHTFWFAWAAFHPETSVHGRRGTPDSESGGNGR